MLYKENLEKIKVGEKKNEISYKTISKRGRDKEL